MQRFTLKCSQNNSRGINKDKNKQLQQPEEFFPSITSSLESLQSPLGAGVRLPNVADLYCHKPVQVVHLCITFLFKRPPSAAFSRWAVVKKSTICWTEPGSGDSVHSSLAHVSYQTSSVSADQFCKMDRGFLNLLHQIGSDNRGRVHSRGEKQWRINGSSCRFSARLEVEGG